MKIGIDIHGVADEIPEFFAEFTKLLISNGHQVHIITGPPDSARLRDELTRLGLSFTHLFSIVDYHQSVGTPMTNIRGNLYCDEYLWDKTKADYCVRENIDLHFDDSDAYLYFFKTPYARFFSKNKRKYFKKEIEDGLKN